MRHGTPAGCRKVRARWRLRIRSRTNCPETEWDASQIKQPHWGHISQAFVDGAREARANPEATEHDFCRAADGYTKRVFEEVDPVSEAALRTGSWKAAFEREQKSVPTDGDLEWWSWFPIRPEAATAAWCICRQMEEANATGWGCPAHGHMVRTTARKVQHG
jgi:hypothetical protein